MAFKGKPSINKRNREIAARVRQQEKLQRRDQRSHEKSTRVDAPPEIDPATGLPLTQEEIEYREFQAALKERREQEALDAGGDAPPAAEK